MSSLFQKAREAWTERKEKREKEKVEWRLRRAGDLRGLLARNLGLLGRLEIEFSPGGRPLYRHRGLTFSCGPAGGQLVAWEGNSPDPDRASYTNIDDLGDLGAYLEDLEARHRERNLFWRALRNLRRPTTTSNKQ